MKRKCLLALLPALLVLSSCNVSLKAGPEVKQDFAAEEECLVEDTLAHEEIFGAAKEAGKLGVRKTANPESVKDPVIGVQWKKSDDNDDASTKITIRYVAAISSLDVQAMWMRAVAKQDSNCPKKFVENSSPVFFESHVGYTSINNDGNVTVPSSLGEGYNYFIVYTLKDIPYLEYKYSYMAAYLTLVDDSTHSPIKQSDIVVVNIDQQHYFSFSSGQSTGYFIEGTIGGVENQIVQIDDDPDGTDKAKKTDLDLVANDNFGLFKFTHQQFQYFGRYNFGGNDTFYLEDSDALSTNYSKVRATGTYSFYVNESNQFNLTPTSLEMDIYLDVSHRWGGATPTESFLIWYKNGENWVWKKMTTVTDKKLYRVTLDVAAHPVFLFIRLEAETADSGDSWPGKNDQTDDITFRNSSDSVLKNQFRIEYWHSGSDEGTGNSSWTVSQHV